MRYVTSHRLVQSVIDELRIPTRPFDTYGVPERTFLRGVFGAGPSDPDAGGGYNLQPHERGRSADDLAREAFRRAVPGAYDLDATGWRNVLPAEESPLPAAAVRGPKPASNVYMDR